MTKKDYVAISRAIRHAENTIMPSGLLCKNTLIKYLCEIFANDNKLFDKERFINACNEGTILSNEPLYQTES